MITIIYSTHKDSDYNNKFKQHLLQSVGLKDVQILEYQNNNQYSLAEVYNRGISESNYDIVVCCHNDIKLENGWGKKLLNDFESNPDFSIIGKAGSCYFPESGIYWERMNQTMVGQVYHHPEGQKKWLNTYSPKLPFLVPVVTIDGLFISFNKNKIKYTFDETIGKFHFYDHLFCLPNYLDGVNIGVTSSFEITHQSVGQPNQEFFDSKVKFLKKFSNHLPLDLKPKKPYIPEIKEKPVKINGKIAIIIPTKGNVDMLFNCVKSIYDNCNPTLFDVFIADTGSTNEEKEWITTNILVLGNIFLIEYDYYNFAKINNDVVKNHINDDYEYLLFCNNDVVMLNNIIYGMIKTFKTNPLAGTVGAKLLYENNTIQHEGIVPILNNTYKRIEVNHINRFNYYNFNNSGDIEVFGNTAALMMILKKVFLRVGMFNENYSNCWEDVEINLKLISNGYKNINNDKCVAYHYESVTRNIDSESNVSLKEFDSMIVPIIKQNFEKIKKYVYVTQ
jgi:GT2 family glycosyltransferase